MEGLCSDALSKTSEGASTVEPGGFSRNMRDLLKYDRRIRELFPQWVPRVRIKLNE